MPKAQLATLLCTPILPRTQHIFVRLSSTPSLVLESCIIVTTPVVDIIVVARPSSCSSLAPQLPTLLLPNTMPRSAFHFHRAEPLLRGLLSFSPIKIAQTTLGNITGHLGLSMALSSSHPPLLHTPLGALPLPCGVTGIGGPRPSRVLTLRFSVTKRRSVPAPYWTW